MLNPVICKHNDTDPGLSGIKATLRYVFMLFCSTVLDCLDLALVQFWTCMQFPVRHFSKAKPCCLDKVQTPLAVRCKHILPC